MSEKEKDFIYFNDRRYKAVVHEEIGWALIRMEDYESAIKEFTKSIEYSNEPGDIFLPTYFYIQRGECYFKIFDYEKAIADFNEALKLEPSHHVALSKRAETNAYFDFYDEAIEDLTKLVEKYPDNERYYFKRGVLYIDAGSYAKAIEDFKKVLDLDPSNESAAHNLKILTENT